MKRALAIAGMAIALSMTGATAFATDHNRGDHDRGPAFERQDNDHRFDGRRDRDRNFKLPQNQQHNFQPAFKPQQKHWNNNGWQQNNNWQQNNKWQRNRKWRGRDFDHFRFNRFADKRFRLGSYKAPRNFRYHRWSYGDHLPFVFLASHYWLSNNGFYGLFDPPPGLIWVRYGDDALLVDRYTGEIVQVRYNVFY